MSKPNIAKAYDEYRADYNMSRESRFVRRRGGLAPRGGSADYHLRNEEHYYKDIEKARDMDRNDAVVGQIVDRSVSNEVQDGFTLDPQTGDKAVDDELYARWQEFANDPELCDIAGEFTWHDFEIHSSRSSKVDGDCVVLGTEGGQLQFIEAHEVQTTTKVPNTILGVTQNSFGRRGQYWIMQDGIEPTAPKLESRPYEVRNQDGYRQLFHVFNPKRLTQTRGVTVFAPIFELAGMFEDIQFAKLVQQQVVSCFAVFREQAAQGGDGLPNKNASYGQSDSETTSSGTRYIENIAPGMEIIGRPGEKLHGFSPDVPNAEYFTHVRLMLQMIGVNLGLPLCLVLMDGAETNFSGWRGAVDEARKGFRRNQTSLVHRLHKPVYEWKVSQWIAEDTSLRNQASKLTLFRHKWNPPRWAYIDPIGDAQGDHLRLQSLLTSPRRLHAERGAEFEEVVDEAVADYAYAIRAAKKMAMEINKEYQDDQPLHWRELVNLPMPSGWQMQLDDTNSLKLQEELKRKTPNV